MTADTTQPWRYLFGPIPSRRLGFSLGVDLFPTKVCTHNCPYCECGSTRRMTVERSEFVPFDDVAAELRAVLPYQGLDYVTFSGNGEPTLYSRLGDLIRLIRTLSDTRVAVITNSALVMHAEVRSELVLADLLMPSLDAVTPEAMRRINGQHPAVKPDEMIDGLIELRREYAGEMWLEVFFCRGLNDDPEEVRLLAEAARRIAPDRVQLNTVDRPPARSVAQPLTRAELEAIATVFDMPGVEVIGAFHAHGSPEIADAPREQILSMISRRGVAESDLISALGMDENRARPVLDALVAEGRIRRDTFDGRAHYRRA